MKKTKIEWCDSTWNPVTGCLHGCSYCYAKEIVNRFGGYTSAGSKTTFNPYTRPAELHHPMLLGDRKAPYPFGFHPTFHRYRLTELQKWNEPKTVFVCSMADLFGDWVPLSWIKDVMDACCVAPQHRYLFLTKNPKRYLQLEKLAILPHGDQFWYGSTVTTEDDYAAWFDINGLHWFVSIEPLHGRVDITRGTGTMPEWVIIGAETGNRNGKVSPDPEWIREIVSGCKAFDVPVFMKDSVHSYWAGSLLTEFPWEEPRG